jgi:hypothetical protein
MCEHLRVAAATTRVAIRPTVRDRVGAARIFIGQCRFPLRDFHLLNLLFAIGMARIRRSCGHLTQAFRQNNA